MDCTKNAIERTMSRRFQVSLVFEGACVGLVASAIVTAYRIALAHAEDLLDFIRLAVLNNWNYLILWIIGVIAVMWIVGKLMMWEPFTQGSGIPHIDAEVEGLIDIPWYRVIYAKFIEGTLCTLAGLSLGREGPAVQLGGMGGKAVARFFKRGDSEERILVTCGAGAGMAAAFHAPLTGVMFTIEEIHKVFSAPLIISVMVSCVVSDFFVSQVLGIDPVLSMKFAQDLPHGYYPFIIIMGIILGFLGAAHNKGMFEVRSLYKKIGARLPYGRLLIPFALSIPVAIFFPDLVCGGDAIAKTLASINPKPLSFLIFLLLGKYIYTAICFGSDAPGGTLFPLVVMGALSGAIFGNIAVSAFSLDPIFITNFMVLGIAGLFAGVVRAPVTGIMLAFELTGTFDSMLSAALVAIIAYVSANMCKSIPPFYDKLLEDFLGVNVNDFVIPDETKEILHTHIVQHSSMLIGKKIKDIRWPHGVLVISIKRCGQDLIPEGDTVIHPMDKLLVIMNMTVEHDAERQLKHLTENTVIRQ